MRIAALAVLFLMLTAAPVHAQPAPVDATLSQSVAFEGLAGGVVVIRDGAHLTRYSAGYSDVDTKDGFAPNTHVRVGSITKTFVAATVLQLVAEGKIKLDEPIETYLPGRIRGEGIDATAITVRQLLRHQSGLPDYFDDLTEVPQEPVSGDRLLDMALPGPAQFAPGAAMKYTNTNYIIAGLLIERITGRPAADEITARIMLPLGLFDTYFPAPGDRGLRVPFAHGYEVLDGSRTDVTDFNASAAWTAGGLVSTNEDTTAFYTALLDGRVVPGPQLEEMMRTVPMPDTDGLLSYGLGLGRVSLPCGVTAWGHGGDINGFHSFAVKTVDGPAVSVTLTQSPESTAPADDPRGAILDALYCPA
nr:serine hydrolase domain-containing protein [Mycolicibacterium malmesburyense]CRL76713.1 beta-lactamase [Mycolicibacterium malmesburyense]